MLRPGTATSPVASAAKRVTVSNISNESPTKAVMRASAVFFGGCVVGTFSPVDWRGVEDCVVPEGGCAEVEACGCLRESGKGCIATWRGGIKRVVDTWDLFVMEVALTRYRRSVGSNLPCQGETPEEATRGLQSVIARVSFLERLRLWWRHLRLWVSERKRWMYSRCHGGRWKARRALNRQVTHALCLTTATTRRLKKLPPR